MQELAMFVHEMLGQQNVISSFGETVRPHLLLRHDEKRCPVKANSPQGGSE